MASRKILIAEDDESMLHILKHNLLREGYDVVTAADGNQALLAARSEQPALVILDIMLPQLSGFEVCRILRKETMVPILMLTAKDDEIDKIVGLEIGADDYVTKPFSMRELLARIRAMLRRAEMPQRIEQGDGGVLLSIDDLQIDLARREVTRSSAKVALTPKEFDLLAFLAKNRGIAFSRQRLLASIWHYDYAGDTRTVDVHIRWLREKIEVDPGKPRRLVTVRGVGYKLQG